MDAFGPNDTLIGALATAADDRKGYIPGSIPLYSDGTEQPPHYTNVDVVTRRANGMYVLPRFGRNPDCSTTPEDIWNLGGDYTGWPTTAAEQLQVLSDSVNDAAAGTGARVIRVYYHDENYSMFNANGTFRYVDVTLNGTTPVNTGVTAMRVWYARVISSGSGTSNAGTIRVRWETTTTVVFCGIPPGQSSSQLSQFTVPAGYVGYIMRYSASMLGSVNNRAEMIFRVRDFGTNTFVHERNFSIATDSDTERMLYGGRRIEEKSDLCMRTVSVTNAGAVITISYDLLIVPI